MISYITGGKITYDHLWKAIIRPPRANYAVQQLGPKEFSMGDKEFFREDFTLINNRNQKIQCSHFQPMQRKQFKQMPCVIYCHANASSRCGVLNNLRYLLPFNMTVVCFDFAGCGISDGEYISLGHYEKDDLKMVIDFLRNDKGVSTIGLWGRSMGAVTALMHAHRDPTIGGIVLDSPFTSLNELVKEMAYEKASVPGIFTSSAMYFIKKTIQEKQGFDINDLSPIKNIQKCFTPSYFIHGKEDKMISYKHSVKLHSLYGGDSKINLIKGGHNSKRNKQIKTSISQFLYKALRVEIIMLVQQNLNNGKPINLEKPQSINQKQMEKQQQVDQKIKNFLIIDNFLIKDVGEDQLNEQIKLQEQYEDESQQQNNQMEQAINNQQDNLQGIEDIFINDKAKEENKEYVDQQKLLYKQFEKQKVLSDQQKQEQKLLKEKDDNVIDAYIQQISKNNEKDDIKDE